MLCSKNYIGQVLYGADFEWCGGSNGDGVDKDCKGCSCFCRNIYDLTTEKVREVTYKWGIEPDEQKRLLKELGL